MARKKKDAENAAPENPQEAAIQTENPQEAAVQAETAEEVSPPVAEAPEPQTPEPKPQPPGKDGEEPPEGPTLPYEATVNPAILVFRYKPDGAPVGTLTRGTAVTVTGRTGEYAQLANGIFVIETHLAPR